MNENSYAYNGQSVKYFNTLFWDCIDIQINKTYKINLIL